VIDYASTAREAYDALREAGALVTLSWTVTPDYDPAQPEPVPAVVSVATYGAVLEYNFREVGTQPDSLVRAGDRQLLLAAVTPDGAALPEPPLDAVATLADGSSLTLKNVRPLAPAGVPVLYDITLRRS
jgi:hypothetical protein